MTNKDVPFSRPNWDQVPPYLKRRIVLGGMLSATLTHAAPTIVPLKLPPSRGLMGAPLDAIETGRLGGQLYDSGKLGRLGRYLDRRKVTLRVGDEFLPPDKGGGFWARPDGSAELLLRSNPTEYEVWHELGHYRQWQQIGPDKKLYLELPRWSRAKPIQDVPEQFVFDLLENSKERRWCRFTPEQQQHAIDYLLGVPERGILGKGGIR